MTIKKGFEQLGLDRIYLIVRKSNPRARRLYQHCDFRDTGECRKEVNWMQAEFLEMELGKEDFKEWMSNGFD